MATFKEQINEIGLSVANEFDGWSYSSGKFKNKSIKFAELIIDFGVSFGRGFGHLQPCIAVNNKRTTKLMKDLLGYSIHTSSVDFQKTNALLSGVTGLPVPPVLICQDKSKFIEMIGESGQFSKDSIYGISKNSIDLIEIPSIFRGIVEAGIAFINSHYVFRGEKEFLENLPVKYETRNEIIYDEWERQKGVLMCIARIILGDFDFVERYRGDNFKTIFPKRLDEIDKIISVLPDIKRRYKESDFVI